MQAEVLVCVPTYRRPSWAWELLSALAHEVGEVEGARILVLDNDPDGTGAGLIEHPAVHSGLARVVHLGAGDVVSVRNAAVETAVRGGSTLLVFIDDDELPGPGWLTALVRTAEETGADVVCGPVVQDASVPSSPAADALLSRPTRPDGPFVGDVGTGNVGIRVGALGGLRFEPRLSALGGEDTLLFRQLREQGARFVWAEGAVVVERQQPDRLTRRALLRRSLHNGRSSVLVEAQLSRPSSLVRRLAVAGGAAAWYTPHAVVRWVRGDRTAAWRDIFKVVRHAGRVVPVRSSQGRYAGSRTRAET